MGKKLVFLKNERGQWDLPGGKIDHGENPAPALVREFREELSIDVQVGRLLDVLQVRVLNMINVVVILFECQTQCCQDDILLSHEHFDIGIFTPEEVLTLNLVPEYRPYITELLKAKITDTI
jgi:8-oxo-dGTP pyrophosphatase MutT (NUDIX family)